MINIIGPTYEFVREDIYYKSLKHIKFEQNECNLKILKKIIERNIPVSKSMFKYGSWKYYKQFGLDKYFLENLFDQILSVFTIYHIDFEIIC